MPKIWRDITQSQQEVLSAIDHLFSSNNKPGFSIRSRREGAQGAEDGR